MLSPIIFDLPFASIAAWLHFIIAKTAWATDGNSTRPDDERSDFNGNILIADGSQSSSLNVFNSFSSVRSGGVLKKWSICKKTDMRIMYCVSSFNVHIYLYIRQKEIKFDYHNKDLIKV